MIKKLILTLLGLVAFTKVDIDHDKLKEMVVEALKEI
jgi:hypothetical protein